MLLKKYFCLHQRLGPLLTIEYNQKYTTRCFTTSHCISESTVGFIRIPYKLLLSPVFCTINFFILELWATVCTESLFYQSNSWILAKPTSLEKNDLTSTEFTNVQMRMAKRTHLSMKAGTNTCPLKGVLVFKILKNDLISKINY